MKMEGEEALEWQVSAQAYLQRLTGAEYCAGKNEWTKRGRVAWTFKYRPSEYCETLVRLLGENDEEGFKAVKAEQGYSSKAGA